MAVQATNLINLYPSPLMPPNRESISTQFDANPALYGSNLIIDAGIGQMIPMSAPGISMGDHQIGIRSTTPMPEYCSSNFHDNSLIIPFYATTTPATAPAPFKDNVCAIGFGYSSNATVPMDVQQRGSRKRQRGTTTTTTNSAFAQPPPSSDTGSGVAPKIRKVVGAATGPNSCGSSPLTSFGHQDLWLQMTEMDQLISSYMEGLRFEIVERHRAESRRIMEAVMMKTLSDTEEQIAKIGKMNDVLEEKVNALSIENQLWRGLAQTNEATANALKTKLDQILVLCQSNQINDGATAGTEDAESCCGSTGPAAVDGDESEAGTGWIKVGGALQEEDELGRGKKEGKSYSGGCRRCGKGESRVLLLPCRHLCLCSDCGPEVEACPMCYSVKAASVLVNLY